MFKCPICGKSMNQIFYTKLGRRFRYLICECGWTNKPKDVPENVKTETDAEE